MLPDLDLGVFVLASPTVTFSGVTGSTGSYTVTVTLSGRVTIGFVDGARPVGGSAALTGTYTVAGEALDAGDLALTLDDLVLTLGDVVTVRAATASLAQDGGDLVVTASAVTAALTVPNGPALQLTATSLDLLVQADRDVAFRVAGGTLSLTGVPGVSATGTGWSLVHNGTGADVTLGGTTVLGTVDVQAGGAASLVVAGQTLTATTLTVQRSGRTLTLAATGLGRGAQRRRHRGAHRVGRDRHPRRRRHRHQRHPHRDRDDRAHLHAAHARPPHRSRSPSTAAPSPPSACPPVRSCGSSPPASRWPSARSGPSPGRCPSSARPARAAPRWSCSA